MPQILGIAILGVALYGAYRVVKREMNRVGAELDTQPVKKPDTEAVPKLVKDPETGVYHPEERT